MKYPYIAKLTADDSKLALFTGPATATALTDNFADIKIGESDSEWDERFYKNITREYLSNTWGVVESKEHAEFIIELAELHGFKVWGDELLNKVVMIRFVFIHGELMLHSHDCKNLISEYKLKQITIPLPPKAKEWPQVGDEIVTRGGGNGILMISNPDKDNMVVCNFYGEYALVYFDDLQKPKSKQDLLIEELQTKLCNNNAVDNYILACDIVNGEIEGLSYEP